MENNNLLLTTAYLPPLAYFASLINSQTIYIECFETYHKQTYRNRCEIYSANGKFALTIPVNKTNGNHTLTKDIEISNVSNWQKMHWRAIESAYNCSPFFLYYKDLFLPFYEKKYKYLIDFNHHLLALILKTLKINVKINTTIIFEKQPMTLVDLRNAIIPKSSLNQLQEKFPAYIQVFQDKYGFLPNLSIIDLLFNEGNFSKDYLLQIK